MDLYSWARFSRMPAAQVPVHWGEVKQQSERGGLVAAGRKWRGRTR